MSTKTTSLALRRKQAQDLTTREDARSKFRKGGEIVLGDCSGSMETGVPGTGTGPRTLKSRWQCLCESLEAFGEQLMFIGYEDQIHFMQGVNASTLRPGHGSVELLNVAIKAALEFEPNYVLVIGDGQLVAKNDEPLSLKFAAELAQFAIIDTLYIGPENSSAETFMRELARVGNGRYKRYDTTKPQSTLQLTNVIQGLLPPPSGDIAL